MDSYIPLGKIRGRWSVTNAGTAGSAAATKAATTAAAGTGRAEIQAIADLTVSGDKACVVTIESPAGTVLWQVREAGAFVLVEDFKVPITGAPGAAILAKVSDGTAHTELNISGVTL